MGSTAASVETLHAPPPLRRILVALDGSDGSERALELALRLSRQFGSDLILCTALDHEREIAAASMPDVVYPNIAELIERYDAQAKSLLRDAQAKAFAAGARASTAFLEGRPAVAVARYAGSHDVDAIVMGTHGRRGLERLMIGSTAEGVLRLSAVPIVVMHDDAVQKSTELAFARILVAVDESAASDDAVAFALSLATGNEAFLFCSALDTTELAGNAVTSGFDPVSLVSDARRAASKSLEARTLIASASPVRSLERVILEGSPANAVLDAARDFRADLVVCGTHGRRGLRRMLLGSVAAEIVRRSAVPVAVVPSRP